MNKKIKFLFWCMLFLGVVLSGFAARHYGKVHADGGAIGGVQQVATLGSSANPYEIANCTDLQNVNSENSSGIFYYVLSTDINCTGTNFVPITSFGGNFDGNGHTITDLTENYNAVADNVGLFAEITGNGSVENLTLTSAAIDVTGTNSYEGVGVLAGNNNSGGQLYNDSVTNSTVSITTTGCTSDIGGLVGSTNATLTDSSFQGNVTYENTNSCSAVNVGGLSGIVGGTFSNDFANAVISITGQNSDSYNAGGLIGNSSYYAGYLSNVYSTGSLTVNNTTAGYNNIGGILGVAGGGTTLANSFTTTNLSTQNNSYVGAIVGYNSSGIDVSSTYYDQTAVGVTQCNGLDGTENCTAVNTSGSPDSTYFDNNDNNPPMYYGSGNSNNWDFTNTWQTTNNLPVLSPLNSDPTAPTNLYGLTEPNTAAVNLSWTAPTYSGESPITTYGYRTGYYLTIQQGGSNTLYFEYTGTANSSYTLYGLKANTEYTIAVYAINQDGFVGPVSSPTSITTNAARSFAISNCQQLQDMNNDLSGNYVLTQDINCSATSGWNSGLGFMPIGHIDFINNSIIPFAGTFNGNGHKITGMYENYSYTAGGIASGLFLVLGDAAVSNVTLESSNVSGSLIDSILAGAVYEATTITNVQVKNASITALNSGGGGCGTGIGGLVSSSLGGTISQSSFSGTLTIANSSCFIYFGGLVAEASPESYNISINNSYADTVVNGSASLSYYTGGLLAITNGLVSVANSYATGTFNINNATSGQGTIVGGIAAATESPITENNSFSNTTLTTSSLTRLSLGGIIGETRDSYNLSSDYFDSNKAGTSYCDGGQAITDCHTETDPGYFINNNTNQPMKSWDFKKVWAITSGLPTFIAGQTAVTPTPPTKNPSKPSKPPTNLFPYTPILPTSNNSTTPKTSKHKSSSVTTATTNGTNTPTSSQSSASGSSHGISKILSTVGGAIKHFLKHIPAGVIVSFPYVLCGLLLLTALLVIVELVRQSRKLKALQLLLAKQTSIAEERDTFWHLAANYLRAPITLLVGGAELLSETKQSDKELSSNITKLANSLQTKVGDIMRQIEKSHSLKDIRWPKINPGLRVLRQARFWVPVLLVAGLGILTDYIAKDFRHISSSTISYLTQFMIYVIVVIVLYWFLSRLSLTGNKRQWAELLIKGQKASLDRARKKLIATTAEELDTDVARIESSIAKLPEDNKSLLMLHEGSRRLRQIIDSFQLLINVQNGTLAALSTSGAMTSLGQTLHNTVEELKPLIDSKQLQVSLPDQVNQALPGSKILINQVVGSVLANSVDFSPHAGIVNIEVIPQAKSTILKISDNGPGMSPDQISHLFQPFTRADGLDALQLDHGGLGINLYLDKLIMDFLGGTITAKSEPGKGSSFIISWPVRKEALAGGVVMAGSTQQHALSV